MAYTSPTTVNMSQGFPSVVSYLNEVTTGWFFNMLIIALYVIILMGYARTTQDWIGGFGVAGFVTFVIGTLLFLGSAISGFTFALVIGFMLVSLFIVLLGKN